MKRQIINTAAALKTRGICAAMMLVLTCAFAANSASAQAQTTCPEGQTLLTKVWGDPVPDEPGCVPDDALAIMEDCEKAGWLGLDAPTTAPSSPWVVCGIPSNLHNRATATFCWILRGTAASDPSCADMFGVPPRFPKASDHPNVETDGVTAGPIIFAANCDLDGTVPGGYPPDHNLNGEYECSCDLDSHIGAWPDCVAAPDLTRAQREAVRACPSQGWNISTATAAVKCEIPLTSVETDTDYDGCFVIASTGTDTPLCEEVFGEEYAFPARMLSGLAEMLFNGFKAIADLSGNSAHIKTAAGVYRDAVLARYIRDTNYLAGPLANIEANSDDNNRTIAVSVLEKVFSTDHGIPFDFSASGIDHAARLAALPGLVTAAFDMIPQIDPYVFNCGEGMSPAGANTNGATECVLAQQEPDSDPALLLRLRVFLEGPLR